VNILNDKQSFHQLALQFSNNRETLKNYFEKMTGKHISLIVTDNSCSLLSIKKRSDKISVRMHWMFLNAGNEIIREIIDFIKNRNGRTPLIRKFISDNQVCLKKAERKFRQVRIFTQGRFHDLKEIFHGLNNEYFGGIVTASVSWGKGKARKIVRKRTLGSYCRQTNAIRINPILDRKNVPQYFIRYVVYHEMLHSIVPEEKKNGRRSVHSPDFRKRERLFKDYAKAVSWERKWI